MLVEPDGTRAARHGRWRLDLPHLGRPSAWRPDQAGQGAHHMRSLEPADNYGCYRFGLGRALISSLEMRWES